MNLDGDHTPGILETSETMPFGKPFLDGRLHFSHIFLRINIGRLDYQRYPEVAVSKGEMGPRCSER